MQQQAILNGKRKTEGTIKEQSSGCCGLSGSDLEWLCSPARTSGLKTEGHLDSCLGTLIIIKPCGLISVMDGAWYCGPAEICCNEYL
ncbi:hypothetical protein E2C01_007328 [Portunus trituberculatus]|uniref:Uncharacterized protein n=1 Tax=Portunus trituberculatus TaxID=210409 RepID=A0A5B7CYP8_PORTR|nr:hypothetical protein [Portunus trituberculatus]